MRPGSKEEFLTSTISYHQRSITDRRKKNIQVPTERRINKERRTLWRTDPETGNSFFTG